jgi:hypothetical protein
MRTGEPSPRSNGTSNNSPRRDSSSVFPGGHIDAYTDSFAHSLAWDCFEHSGSNPQRRPSEHSDGNDPRCSADTMRPPRELDWRSPTKRRSAATSGGLKFSAPSNALRSP